MNQPIQPLYTDEHGTTRFKANAIVRYILDNGGVNMNRLAVIDFSREDREQFAQLIGYSLSGFGSLSYATDETYETAEAMFKEGKTETQARIEYLETEIAALRESLVEPMARLFGRHPDDFRDGGS